MTKHLARTVLCTGVLALALWGASLCGQLHAGFAGARRPVLPERRQRRLRRLALRADARLHAGGEPARRHGRDHGDSDAGSLELQPRPARVRDLAAARQRPAASFTRDGEQELGDHAERRGSDRARRSPSRSTTPARRRRHRPGRVDRGLGADGRRRVRRQRAAGLARRGTRSTTTRATRRPTTSASPCPRG